MEMKQGIMAVIGIVIAISLVAGSLIPLISDMEERNKITYSNDLYQGVRLSESDGRTPINLSIDATKTLKVNGKTISYVDELFVPDIVFATDAVIVEGSSRDPQGGFNYTVSFFVDGNLIRFVLSGYEFKGLNLICDKNGGTATITPTSGDQIIVNIPAPAFIVYADLNGSLVQIGNDTFIVKNTNDIIGSFLTQGGFVSISDGIAKFNGIPVTLTITTEPLPEGGVKVTHVSVDTGPGTPSAPIFFIPMKVSFIDPSADRTNIVLLYLVPLMVISGIVILAVRMITKNKD